MLDNRGSYGAHGLLVAGGLLLALTAILIDPHVTRWAALVKHPWIDAVIALLNPIGSGVVLLVACVLLAGLAHAGGACRLCHAALLGAVAFASAGLVEFSVKHLLGRYRPDADMPVLAVLGPSFVPDVDSFPSGHATSVFAVATVFATFYPRLAWVLYPPAAAIAIGRVYLERHYVSDIVGGAMIGMVVAFAIIDRLARPDYQQT
jgi:membrane-associated phospholipid phosphatase